MKIYNIVTNDEYEFPVVCDVEGAKAVGELLGKTDTYVNKRVCTGRWPKKMRYKAVVIDRRYVSQDHRRRVDRERWNRWYQRKVVM